MQIKKYISMLCFVFLFMLLVGCTTGGDNSNKVVGLEIDEQTFQSEVVIGEFNIRTWKLKEVYGDGGFKLVDFSYDMLTLEDVSKLSVVGTHTLTFSHKGKTCEFVITVNEPSKDDIVEKLNDVLGKLSVPEQVSENFTLTTYVEGISITWESNREELLINKNTAVVNNTSENNVVVHLTATLAYFNETIEKEFEVIVEGVKHEHVYVDGYCECGEKDPNYVEHVHIFVEGKCTCGEKDPNYVEHTHVFINGVCTCGEKDPDYVPDHGGVEYVGTYYDSANLELDDTALLLELRKLITNTHTKETTYGDLRYLLDDTDGAEDDESKVLCLYSRIKYSGTWDGGNSWNREHVWPKSLAWFPNVGNGDKGAGADLHHIRPEDNRVNSVRNNDKFGEVNGGSEVLSSKGVKSGCYSGGGYFEPQDCAKGDTARILFYLFTRYSQADSYRFTAVAQSLEMLLEWNRLDPVDEWEMERNDETAKIQGNRNPFIDHPELADIIWG